MPTRVTAQVHHRSLATGNIAPPALLLEIFKCNSYIITDLWNDTRHQRMNLQIFFKSLILKCWCRVHLIYIFYDLWISSLLLAFPCSQIVECRRVLKWTYAYGYYLAEQEHAKRQFFEYLQGMTFTLAE